MKKLLVVHAAGLSADEAVRGDLAANLSDLIADGSFGRMASAPDLASIATAFGTERVSVVAVPYRDMASFDAALGDLRAQAAASGAALAVVSDSVFISQRYFPEIRPGKEVTPEELPGFLAAMMV